MLCCLYMGKLSTSLLLILTDYHFGSTCIRLAAIGLLIYVLTKIYKVSF